jgi:hypothetical protein
MPAFAQPVTSPGPESVSVTIYREPNAPPDRELLRDWLGGYALITERRTVTLPAGRATIRFEGVAGGILPESAIVTGLPEGVREKNLDADLLSPRNLYARSLNRPVTIRRTIGGKTVEERAIIRSGPHGAAIVETRDGIIAADCRPHTDELVYDEVPAGLSAKPTLSVETESGEARQVTLTLTYLAWGFDWKANYVATMRPDGRSADLVAWLTLASTDVTSFTDAETMVVAGHINHETDRKDTPEPEPLWFHCTSVVVTGIRERVVLSANVDGIVAQDIGALPDRSVTEALQRVPGVAMNRFAGREDLGDLKLYRVPDRTTLASMSQKQVALLDREGVPVDVIYRALLAGDRVYETRLVLRAQNKAEAGLGLPLPEGGVALFEPHGAANLLIGEGEIADKAVGEEVEIDTDPATQVRAELKTERSGTRWSDRVLTVTNANRFPVRFEAELLPSDNRRLTRLSAAFGRHRGRDVWAVEVPANGSATLRYRLRERR